MSESDSYILSGPNDDFDIPTESLGKYLFDCLKRRNANDTVNIDSITKEVLTCGKLLEDSIKLTSVFERLGIKNGDIIAIADTNNINYSVLLLSALYMGVIVSPLNPAYSIGELKHALSVVKAKFIFCSELALKNVLKIKNELQFVDTVILLDTCCKNHYNLEYSKISNIDTLLKTARTDIDSFKPIEFDSSKQVAFILWSSGTTGLPKGVQVTHQNIKALLNHLMHPTYGNITFKDVTVLVLPFFHIFGLAIQLTAIAASMKLILINKFKPDVFLQSIQEYKATKLYLVPPLLLFLTKSPLVKNFDLVSVRDILVGAAAIGMELQKEATKKFGNTTIRQVYGLTECGLCTIQTVSSNKPGSAGILVPLNLAKVWDSNTNEVVGPLRTGELCFKGSMIMKGYYGDTDATKGCIDTDGFFHTGDLGYYDHDGCFYIVDRLKELIKYKGFQVPPAELEALILTHPGVSDCGVVGIPDERAGEVPLAYVVRQNGMEVTEQEIADFVAERISVQKHLHGGVVFTEEIPRSTTGKILRRKLLDKILNTY